MWIERIVTVFVTTSDGTLLVTPIKMAISQSGLGTSPSCRNHRTLSAIVVTRFIIGAVMSTAP